MIYEYYCSVVRVIDGDTVKFEVDHGMNIRSIQNIRLLGVDAPELSTVIGQEARKEAERWVFRYRNQRLILTTEKDSGSFNRYLGSIRPDLPTSDPSLNTYMVDWLRGQAALL